MVWPRRTRRSSANLRISSSSSGFIASNSMLPIRATRLASRSSLATSVSRSHCSAARFIPQQANPGRKYARFGIVVVSRPYRHAGGTMLDEAGRYALSHETPWPRDPLAHLESGYFEAPPFNEVLGPIRPRGGPNGLVM